MVIRGMIRIIRKIELLKRRVFWKEEKNVISTKNQDCKTYLQNLSEIYGNQVEEQRITIKPLS